MGPHVHVLPAQTYCFPKSRLIIIAPVPFLYRNPWSAAKYRLINKQADDSKEVARADNSPICTHHLSNHFQYCIYICTAFGLMVQLISIFQMPSLGSTAKFLSLRQSQRFFPHQEKGKVALRPHPGDAAVSFKGLWIWYGYRFIIQVSPNPVS